MENLSKRKKEMGTSRREFLSTSASIMLAGVTGSLIINPKIAYADSFSEYREYDGLGLADLVRRKEITPEELLETAIAQIESLNPTLNAVVTKMYDEAEKTISKGLPDGPFTGVPFLLKDIGPTYAGVRYTAGSRVLANWIATYDSEMVKRYKSAGLVTLGKTNTPEFGLNFSTEPVLFGPTLNPWDTSRSPGGSSGGSAAAVAARMVPIAHGSDGGGSIRVPSSCCGLFGLKPSRGRMPEESWEDLATNHVLTRSVRDSAAMLDATSAPFSGNPNTLPSPDRPFLEEVGTDPGKLKIAFYTKGTSTHPDCVAAVADAAELCESLGHTVEEAEPNLNDEKIWFNHSIIAGRSMTVYLDTFFPGWDWGGSAMKDTLEPNTWNLALWGRQLTSMNIQRAKAVLTEAEQTLSQFLTDYDLILTPTMGLPPAKLGFFDTVNLAPGELEARMFNTIQYPWIYNDTGLPAMSVPLYWNFDGLPIGVMFAGRHGDEATLLQLARQLEEARPWKDQLPPILF